MKIPKHITENIWLVSWLACLAIFSISALMPTDSPTPGKDWQFDKIMHFLFFAVLTIIPLACFHVRKLAFFCAGIIPIIGLVLEFMQKDIGGREFSPEDMIANNAGFLFGIVCGIILRMKNRIGRQEGTKE